MSSAGLDRGFHSLTLSVQLGPLPPTAAPTLQGALKDGFGEAVLERDMPEPDASLRLLTVAGRGSCGPTSDTDPASHPVAGLVLQV